MSWTTIWKQWWPRKNVSGQTIKLSPSLFVTAWRVPLPSTARPWAASSCRWTISVCINKGNAPLESFPKSHPYWRTEASLFLTSQFWLNHITTLFCRIVIRMTFVAIITCLLSLLSAICITPLVLLLYSFLASILPYKRNLFTYLDQFFIRVALFRVYAGVCMLHF